MWNPLKHFPNRKIDIFSKLLACELAEHYPLAAHQRNGGKKADKKADRKLGRTLNGIYVKARQFREEYKLGVYGKARLGNTFKWELKDMGYTPAFVEEATHGLILSMSRR